MARYFQVKFLKSLICRRITQYIYSELTFENFYVPNRRALQVASQLQVKFRKSLLYRHIVLEDLVAADFSEFLPAPRTAGASYPLTLGLVKQKNPQKSALLSTYLVNSAVSSLFENFHL